MSTALIVTADLGGNLPPLLGIAQELADRGWSVVVHAEEPLRSRVEERGLAFAPAAGRRYDASRNRSTVESLRDVPPFWADRQRGRDAVAVARRTGADVAVVDVLLVGALAELQAADIPTVVVAHSSWEGVRRFFGVPLGLLVRLRGVAPLPTIERAGRVLVASDERLGKRLPLPANATSIGPVLEERPPARRQTARPLVLLGLSTVAFPGQRETLQRLLDAVGTLPVDVRAASGRSVATAELRPGGNTVLTERVDHRAHLPEAAAVITHGGHATTVRALAHGVPTLFVPMHPLMDQPRIAAAVAGAGAGLTVPRSASPEQLRAALQRLLDEPSFREAARRIGADLVAADGAGRGVDEIEALVAHSRSVRLQASSEASSDEPPSSK